MLAGLFSGRVGLRNCANNVNLFLNAHTHSLVRNRIEELERER